MPRLFALRSSLKFFFLCLLGAALSGSLSGSLAVSAQVDAQVQAQVNAQQPKGITLSTSQPALKAPNETPKVTEEGPRAADEECDGVKLRPLVVTSDPSRAAENLSFEDLLLVKLGEAKKLLASSCPIDDYTVGISLLERQSGKLYMVTMAKSDFLTPGHEQQYQLENGGPRLTLRVDQPNYVNTKLSVESSEGLFLPLTVKYPIVKGGMFKEMAYYTPAHRSLLGHNFARLGEDYIEKILSDAASSLKKSGLDIPDKIQKLAKLLCIVEHIDHERYNNEESAALFSEVLTLYALNRGDSYRYSVSKAGAGGMVQMIQRTYREIENGFPQVNWIGDFEAGMINHQNAAKAMLLYLRRYDLYLSNQEVVQGAIESGRATEEELMAAGYNSNPVHLPHILARGADWKYALPYETQTYLTILHSLNSSVTTEPPEPRYHAKLVVYRPNRRGAHRHANMRVARIRSRLKVANLRRSSARTHSRHR